MKYQIGDKVRIIDTEKGVYNIAPTHMNKIVEIIGYYNIHWYKTTDGRGIIIYVGDENIELVERKWIPKMVKKSMLE